MTTEEFSNEFDVLLNSYSITNQFGKTENPTTIELDEYEKSVFLTRAQEGIILDYYNGKNPFRDSFEKTEEIRRYLDALIKTYISVDKKEGHVGLSDTSVFFELPTDLWFITYESVHLSDDKLGCLNDEDILVVPVTQDDYHRTIKNPFRGPNSRRALRLDLGGGLVEIVAEYNISRYLIRYVSRPNPIILTELPDNLSINSVSNRTECELNPVVHRIILERAVQLALNSKVVITDKQ